MRIDRSEIRDELAIALEEMLKTPPHVSSQLINLSRVSGSVLQVFLRDYINYAADKIAVYLSENELTERV